jgi:hypothetical protein
MRTRAAQDMMIGRFDAAVDITDSSLEDAFRPVLALSTIRRLGGSQPTWC